MHVIRVHVKKYLGSCFSIFFIGTCYLGPYSEPCSMINMYHNSDHHHTEYSGQNLYACMLVWDNNEVKQVVYPGSKKIT